jgi:tetrahydromethanopterin S-methyltransferase subunit C
VGAPGTVATVVGTVVGTVVATVVATVVGTVVGSTGTVVARRCPNIEINLPTKACTEAGPPSH